MLNNSPFKSQSSWFHIVMAIVLTPLAAIFLAIPVFILIFMFTTWGTAQEYTVSVSLFIGAIFSAVVMTGEYNKEKQTHANEDKTYNILNRINFERGKTFQSSNSDTTFIVSKDNKRICYIGSGDFNQTYLYPNDIIEFTLEMDESVVSRSTSGASGGLVGAAAGGLLTGGLGAIAGAVIGKNSTTSTTPTISSIRIKIAVRKHKSNLIVLEFLEANTTSGISKNSDTAKRAIREADEWWALLTVFCASSSEPNLESSAPPEAGLEPSLVATQQPACSYSHNLPAQQAFPLNKTYIINSDKNNSEWSKNEVTINIKPVKHPDTIVIKRNANKNNDKT